MLLHCPCCVTWKQGRKQPNSSIRWVAGVNLDCAQESSLCCSITVTEQVQAACFPVSSVKGFSGLWSRILFPISYWTPNIDLQRLYKNFLIVCLLLPSSLLPFFPLFFPLFVLHSNYEWLLWIRHCRNTRDSEVNKINKASVPLELVRRNKACNKQINVI